MIIIPKILKKISSLFNDSVVCANIATINDRDKIDSSIPIILSLVNIEEESTMKNMKYSYKSMVNDKIVQNNFISPTKYFNLYLLFVAYENPQNSCLI